MGWGRDFGGLFLVGGRCEGRIQGAFGRAQGLWQDLEGFRGLRQRGCKSE